jgi:hypothetical protein
MDEWSSQDDRVFLRVMLPWLIEQAAGQGQAAPRPGKKTRPRKSRR